MIAFSMYSALAGGYTSLNSFLLAVDRICMLGSGLLLALRHNVVIQFTNFHIEANCKKIHVPYLHAALPPPHPSPGTFSAHTNTLLLPPLPLIPNPDSHAYMISQHYSTYPSPRRALASGDHRAGTHAYKRLNDTSPSMHALNATCMFHRPEVVDLLL